MPAPEPCTTRCLQLSVSSESSPESSGALANSSTEVLVTNAKLGGRLLAILSAWLLQPFKSAARSAGVRSAAVTPPKKGEVKQARPWLLELPTTLIAPTDIFAL